MGYDKEYALKEFIEHGEFWVQKKLKGKLKTIFDVGSNIGEWALMTASFQPQAEIHTFEISADTYKQMLTNTNNGFLDVKIIPNGFGLSNINGVVQIKYVPDNPQLSTQFKNLALENSEIVDCLVIKGDDYVSSRRIDFIDYLKIDTEGAEGLVLEGFQNTLKQGKVGIIQFEYSYHWVLARYLLMDVYELLVPLGYNIGRLTPEGIEFQQYTLLSEKFDGSDYIAIHNSKMELFY